MELNNDEIEKLLDVKFILNEILDKYSEAKNISEKISLAIEELGKREDEGIKESKALNKRLKDLNNSFNGLNTRLTNIESSIAEIKNQMEELTDRQGEIVKSLAKNNSVGEDEAKKTIKPEKKIAVRRQASTKPKLDVKEEAK